MAAMASQPAMSSPTITIGTVRRPTVWPLWIVASVVGAAAGALVGGEIRSLASTMRGPVVFSDFLSYMATIATAFTLSAVQWLVFRRLKRQLDWWVPATVVASLLNAMVTIPTVLRASLPTTDLAPSKAATIVAGCLALATAGLVVGTAQALVLRALDRRTAWFWIPATILGGALAGAITTAASSQLLGLHWTIVLGATAGVGALVISACQAPVLNRLIR
jgi:hypothetical protein